MTNFEGLANETAANNNDTLNRIAALLNMHTGYQIIIEGHSNATAGIMNAQEEFRLRMLSEQRALTVLEELVRLSVSYSRMTIRGAGFSRMIVPYNDIDNIWINRRVEFILVK
ncbi:MAG: OmpA family protein [Treponema sp.]|nr:OmpA family protein [Treponema sp.]